MTPDTATCPLCDSAPAPFLLANDDFLFGTTGECFRLHRCPECGAAFLHPVPDAATLSAAYPPGYWWTGAGRSGLAARLEGAYREWMLRHHVAVARRHFPVPSPRLLDVGCGSGSFLHVLERATGVRGTGLEVSAEATAAARSLYGLPVEPGDVDSAELPEGSFDFITLFHVLEHLPNPQKALERVSRWLAPGGVLLVQVPNLASWQFQWFGRRWTGIDIPRHLVNYTPGSLAAALRRAGFDPDPPSFFSLRDNAAAMASSLAPTLDPMAMTVRGSVRFAFFRKFLYLVLVLAAQPLALAEALAGRGGTMFVAARKR